MIATTRHRRYRRHALWFILLTCRVLRRSGVRFIGERFRRRILFGSDGPYR